MALHSTCPGGGIAGVPHSIAVFRLPIKDAPPVATHPSFAAGDTSFNGTRTYPG